jgi:hypothetical protein
MNILTYIEKFYCDFINEYLNIEKEKDIIQSQGFSELHYNTVSPYSDLLFPSNKNFFYKEDTQFTEQNNFIGLELYTKENNTMKFFNTVNKNPILNLMFPEKDNLKSTNFRINEYFKTFCSKYNFMTDFSFVSPNTHNNIRFEYKKLHLIIMGTDLERNYLEIKLKKQNFNLSKKLQAIYFLSDDKIEIINPAFKNAFIYGARFEFDDYSSLIPACGAINRP